MGSTSLVGGFPISKAPSDPFLTQTDVDRMGNGLEGLLAGLASISVAGGVNVTVGAARDQSPIAPAFRSLLVLTGTLTADISVMLPAWAGKWWYVQNASAGAFTVNLTTAAGTGVVVGQGLGALLWCDGTNIQRISPDFELTPGVSWVQEDFLPFTVTCGPGDELTGWVDFYNGGLGPGTASSKGYVAWCDVASGSGYLAQDPLCTVVFSTEQCRSTKRFYYAVQRAPLADEYYGAGYYGGDPGDQLQLTWHILTLGWTPATPGGPVAHSELLWVGAGGTPAVPFVNGGNTLNGPGVLSVDQNFTVAAGTGGGPGDNLSQLLLTSPGAVNVVAGEDGVVSLISDGTTGAVVDQAGLFVPAGLSLGSQPQSEAFVSSPPGPVVVLCGGGGTQVLPAIGYVGGQTVFIIVRTDAAGESPLVLEPMTDTTDTIMGGAGYSVPGGGAAWLWANAGSSPHDWRVIAAA